MKNFIIGFIVVVAILALNSDFMGGRKIKRFSVTADTNVSQVKGLSKYVTQQEIDGFALRHWNIDTDKVMNNDKMENLRLLLKSQNTQEILAYMKDNNISADEPLHYGVTPLMYASFYNDIDTTKELIALGADPHKKDRYKLSPMAYAIGNNSIETVKILLENGVKFDEVKKVQVYARGKFYTDFNIKSIEIDENNKTTFYHKTSKEIMQEFDNKVPNDYMFGVIVSQNFLEIAKMALESGYKPYTYYFTDRDEVTKLGNKLTDLIEENDLKKMIENAKERQVVGFDIETYLDSLAYERSLYNSFEYMVDYEPMLDLLLEHNISGQPSQKFMKNIYDDWCYDDYKRAIREKVYYLAEMRQGVDKYAEELTTYQYAKKHNMKWKADRSGLDILMQLLKDKIIVRTPKEPTPYILKLLDENIERHAKYCGDKDLDFERDLVNWNDEIFGMARQYHALFKWEDKPIPETANFKDIKEFIAYLSNKNKTKISEAVVKDINITYNQYTRYLADKYAQTLTEKIKFGSESKQELIDLKNEFLESKF